MKEKALFQFGPFRGASKHSYFFKPVNARVGRQVGCFNRAVGLSAMTVFFCECWPRLCGYIRSKCVAIAAQFCREVKASPEQLVD